MVYVVMLYTRLILALDTGNWMPLLLQLGVSVIVLLGWYAFYFIRRRIQLRDQDSDGDVAHRRHRR